MKNPFRNGGVVNEALLKKAMEPQITFQRDSGMPKVQINLSPVAKVHFLLEYLESLKDEEYNMDDKWQRIEKVTNEIESILLEEEDAEDAGNS
ncbi:hypothetical protein [Terribacillus sp. JSM ZJ617]|uniref:hypothetical protein n=1 Tax=Terribacillus sp. JSM ZJ617 TaxID=3342119 RepID=UPI0035A93B9F